MFVDFAAGAAAEEDDLPGLEVIDDEVGYGFDGLAVEGSSTTRIGSRPPVGIAVSNWQHSNPASALVNNDQGSGGQVSLVLIESGDHGVFQVVREDVCGADLKDTRPNVMRERQHGAKVQIVGEYDVLMSNRPFHGVLVAGPWIADIGPMHGLPSTPTQRRHPCR